jgi:GT2 family glycosyltransferase
VYNHPIGELSRGAVLDVGLKCTHSCRFCYYSYLDKSDDQFRGMRRVSFRSLEDCKAILDGLKANGFLHFDYTGGEPSLHPHIIEITRYAHRELGLKGRMITLGQFLMRRMPNGTSDRLLDDLLDAGIVNFLFSVHAVDDALFRRTTNESWDALRAAMAHLDERRFDYCSNTTVFEWNHRELPAIAREVVRHRVYLHNFILMNAYYAWNQDGKAFGVQARYDAIHPYLTEAVHILEDNGVGVNIRYAPMCGVRGLEKHLVGVVGVRYDAHEWMNEAGHFGGAPAQCASRLPVPQGDIDPIFRKQPADETLPNGVRVIARRGSSMKAFPSPCASCSAREVCDGVDPQYLAQHGADEFEPYTGPLWRFPVHEQRAAYPIPFMIKTEPEEAIRDAVASALAGVPAPITLATATAAAATHPPRVSVVIPCYNYARYLPEAVESVLTQTFTDFEVIVVDDGSTDDSLAVAERLAATHPDRVRVIAQANTGQPAFARNRGIADARGAYVLCLDADDKIAPTMLERCAGLLDTSPQVAIAYTDRRDFDGVDDVVLAGEYDFPRLRFENHISYCALFRKTAWEAIGGYRTNVKGCEDWDFWVAAGARGYTGARIPEPLFWYRRHDTGVYQEALQHFHERRAQIILNNREAYPASVVAVAEQCLAPDSGAPSAPVSAGQPFGGRCQPRPGLVSVIMPTRDRPLWLRRAVASVLAQRWRPLELIVVNDAGSDVTSLLRELDDEGIVTHLRLPERRERSAARNAGLALASGEFVAYLDDDDWWDEDHVGTLVQALATSDAGLVYSDPRRVLEERRGDVYVAVDVDHPYQQDFDFGTLLARNFITTCSALHRRECTDTVGGFDETLATHEDWDLWIRIAERWPIRRVPCVTSSFSWRMDGSSTSSAQQDDFLRTQAIVWHRHLALSDGLPVGAEIRRCLADYQARCGSARPFDVSIVIPVRDHLELTRHCLETLATATAGPHCELVIVDDGSASDTQAFLAALSGDVRIVRHEIALGDAVAKNTAAQAARGRFLLFLRNGTIPTSKWLSTLVDEMVAHPEVAVVGSKLLDADGAIQHAGLAISRHDGAPYPVYRGASADAECVNRRREMQAVSGTCMLVRRDAFEAAGGFDEGYRDGLDDVDLCLTIRANGGRVVYQPRSILVSPAASATNAESNPEDLRRFRQRWNDRLVPDDDAIYASDGSAMRLDDLGQPLGVAPFVSPFESRAWDLVAAVQRRAIRDGYGAVRGWLHDANAWPSDPSVLEWAANVVCPAAGLPAHAPRFAHRAQRLRAATPRHVGEPAPVRVSSVSFDCSIIIPVFNRADLTEQCLVTLADVTRGVTFEVILIDNASNDGTAALLASLGGDVQIIRNEENRGFAVACNQGARAARGRHLVFLNNDTVPLPGWLTALVTELDTDPDVAVVGSKLLFADGTIQHAGVIFGRELPLPYHAFYRATATLPAVNRRRELQCVTAACMAVRREVFEAIGGFDEGYRNGFEDVDFCLQVRERGGRVIYQPQSTLYHLESQTAGRKTHDETNAKRLMDRWSARWYRIGDEDVVLAPEGWCARLLDGTDSKFLAPVSDPDERRRWNAVARAQRALLDDDVATLRAILTSWSDWPADASVQRWVDRLRRLAGVAPETGASAIHA